MISSKQECREALRVTDVGYRKKTNHLSCNRGVTMAVKMS